MDENQKADGERKKSKSREEFVQVVTRLLFEQALLDDNALQVAVIAIDGAFGFSWNGDSHGGVVG